MKTTKWFIGIFFAALLLVSPAVAADVADWTQVVEQIGMKGKVDWSQGYIEAVGIGAPPERYYGKPQGRPMALRAAQLDAYRNLLEVVEGVRITSSTTVKDFVTESDEIRAQVQGMVKGAQVAKREYLSDGTVEVTVRMGMHGGFTQLVLPTEVRQVPEVKMDKPVVPIETPEPPATPAAPAAPAAPVENMVFTGLVIDARSIAARPAMAPKILDEEGREVYGSAYVSREYAVQQGMAGYAKDLTAAQSNPRVTNSPITVKGLKTDGPGRADIVISTADAAKLRESSENLSFLKKCRVMIVLD